MTATLPEDRTNGPATTTSSPDGAGCSAPRRPARLPGVAARRDRTVGPGRPCPAPQSRRPVPPLPARTTDGELAALAAGDPQQWGATTARYSRLVSFAARKVLRREVDVEDAVQRTWVLLWKHAGQIDQADRLPGWLATTARREALSILAAQKREEPSDEICGAAANPYEFDGCDARLAEQRSTALAAAIATLPVPQRRVVEALLSGEDLCYDALSDRLGIPRGSIGPLRGRAVATLRDTLAPLRDCA